MQRLVVDAELCSFEIGRWSDRGVTVESVNGLFEMEKQSFEKERTNVAEENEEREKEARLRIVGTGHFRTSCY